MLKRKIGIVVATTMVVVLIAGGLFFWLTYFSALKDQEKEWYKSEYIQKEFKGVIKEIGNYNYNPKFKKEFLNLTISTTDTLDPEVHYGMLNFKKEPLLKTFISKGDSVFKTKGIKEMIFKKPNGETKTFKLPIDIKE